MAYAKKSSEGMTKWEVFVRGANDFGTFLYDKETKTVMGRNAASWGKITVFFVIFYLCLAGFFAAMLSVFLTTLPARSEGPKLTQYLAGKPVLSPVPSNKIKAYNPSSASAYASSVDKINSFLKPYEKQVDEDIDSYDDSFCNASVAEARPVSSTKQCRFDLTSLGPCYKNESGFSYGYNSGTPCFFLRVNKVYNFVPEPKGGLSYAKVVCEPENKAYKDYIKVYPEQTPGFPVSFFPYHMEDKWLAPVVAVYVNTTAKVTVKCDVDAKNIEQSKTYLLERGAFGRVRIELGARA